MEPPMTVKELSEYLRLDRMTIYKMLKEASIPASRIGHQWRFFRDDIDEWIRSRRIGQLTSVLVVNGDLRVRGLFDADLASDRYDVVIAESGDEAISHANQRSFDLVFIELKKGAVDIFQQIRDIDETVPVVVVASGSDGRLVDQAMDVGAFTLARIPTAPGDIQNIFSSLPIRKHTVV